jgi:hypothetical protein
MEDPKGLQLFQEVLSKTKAGRIKWQPTASEYEYVAVLPGGFTLAVLTFFERDSWGNSEEGIALVLRGDEGELLRVSGGTDGVTWTELSGLRELARRQALRVDAKVDKLLGELAKL